MESRNDLGSKTKSQGSTEPSQDSRHSQDSGPTNEINQQALLKALASLQPDPDEEQKLGANNPEQSLVKGQDYLEYINVRIVIVGPAKAGKSTLLEVLRTQMEVKDDGQGGLVQKREKSFGAGHQEIMGFDQAGRLQYEQEYRHIPASQSWPIIMKSSSKVVQFFDYRGSEKFSTQNITEIVGIQPMYAIIAIGADQELQQSIVTEYLGLCQSMKIPFLIAITKTDIVNQKQIMQGLKQLFKSISIRIEVINDKDSVQILQKTANSIEKATIPVFSISSVTLQGFAQLFKFVSLLPPLKKYVPQVECNFPSENFEEVLLQHYTIFCHYQISKGVIVEGILIKDDLELGVQVDSHMLLGPNRQGRFTLARIIGIEEHRHTCKKTLKGRPVCFLLELQRPASSNAENIKEDWRAIEKEFFARKGMGLFRVKEGMTVQNLEAMLVWQFEAELKVFASQSRVVAVKYQVNFHWRQSSQTVEVTYIKEGQLKSGQQGLVRLRFMLYPELLQPGARFILRDGKIVAMGIVSRVLLAGTGV